MKTLKSNWLALGAFGIAALVLWLGVVVDREPRSSLGSSSVEAAAEAGPAKRTTLPAHGGAPLDVQAAPHDALAQPPFEIEPGTAEHTAPLAARFDAEPSDDRWAAFQGAMRGAIDDALAAANTAGSRLVSLECRSTLCRTEVELASPAMLSFTELGGRVQEDERVASTVGKFHLQGERAVIYTAPPGLQLE